MQIWLEQEKNNHNEKTIGIYTRHHQRIYLETPLLFMRRKGYIQVTSGVFIRRIFYTYIKTLSGHDYNLTITIVTMSLLYYFTKTKTF